MINWIIRLFKGLDWSACTDKERTFVEEFLDYGHVAVDQLIDYFNNTEIKFTKSGRDYISPSGLVHVCMDIYGPEVKIGSPFSSPELLDCNPAYYKLNKEQANELYHAILSNIPGTVDYNEKMTRLYNIPEAIQGKQNGTR